MKTIVRLFWLVVGSASAWYGVHFPYWHPLFSLFVAGGALVAFAALLALVGKLSPYQHEQSTMFHPLGIVIALFFVLVIAHGLATNWQQFRATPYSVWGAAIVVIAFLGVALAIALFFIAKRELWWLTKATKEDVDEAERSWADDGEG